MDAQKLVRGNKKACLSNLYKIIYNKVSSNGDKMPSRYMSTLIKENQKDFVWLTRGMVKSVYTRYKKRRRLEENSEKEQPTILQTQIDDEKNSSLRTPMSDLSTNTVYTNSSNDTNIGVIVSDGPSIKNRAKEYQ